MPSYEELRKIYFFKCRELAEIEVLLRSMKESQQRTTETTHSKFNYKRIKLKPTQHQIKSKILKSSQI